jgi:hypothetical protein
LMCRAIFMPSQFTWPIFNPVFFRWALMNFITAREFEGWTSQCDNVLFFIEDNCRHYKLFVTSLKLCQVNNSCISQYLNETNQSNVTTEKEFIQQTFYSRELLTHTALLFFMVNEIILLFFSICGRLGWLHCRSQWQRGLRRRSTAARLLRLWVRIPPGAWMSVCCVLSGRGLCDGLIARPEESYRLWRVVCVRSRKPREWGDHSPRWAAAPCEKKRVVALNLPNSRLSCTGTTGAMYQARMINLFIAAFKHWEFCYCKI